MAKPRVFLSSTFYDLKHVRNDLERFIIGLGYEPVLSERGHIPYGKSERLEESCYRGISTCDIFVHIIGGKYGSPSEQKTYSISQIELKTAHELHKQTYIFIEKQVHVEYRTFLKNENNKSFSPQYVDDMAIYKFIKEIYGYASNNIISDFDSVHEIVSFLSEQWAGLFQRFLQEESRREDYKISLNLKTTAETLYKLIEYTTRERDETIKSILVYSHPIFSQITDKIQPQIKVFFTNYQEMAALFRLLGFKSLNDDDPNCKEFERESGTTKLTMIIEPSVFDEEYNLLPVPSGVWNNEFVKFESEEISRGVPEDDLPF